MIPTPADWITVRDACRELANIAYPQEACGFLFTYVPDPGPTWGVYVVLVDNVAEWPYAQYRIRPEDARWALRTGRCIGVWHSHPNDPAVPSELDVELAVPGLYQVIYAVQDEDLGVFLVEEDGRLVPQAMVMPAAAESEVRVVQP